MNVGRDIQEVERALIGTLLLDRSGSIFAELTVKPWMLQTHFRVVAEAIWEVHSEGEYAPALVYKKLDEGTAIIAKEARAAVDKKHIFAIEAAIKTEYLRKSELEIVRETEERLLSGTNPDEVLAYANTMRETAREWIRDESETQLKSMQKVLDRAAQALKNGTNVTGLDTGYNFYNRLTGGLQPGSMYVLAAKEKHGKTDMLLTLCKNLSEKGYPGFVVSLEMERSEYYERLQRRISGVSPEEIATANLNAKKYKAMQSAFEQIHEWPLYIEDLAFEWEDIKTAIRRAKMRYNIKWFAIDYLQIVTLRGYKDPTEEVSRLSRNIKMLAKETGCAAIILSQLNRSVDGTDTKVPQLHHLRQSGAIAQDADLVSFMMRPIMYDIEWDEEEGDVRNKTLVTVAANRRMGKKGREWMTFDDFSGALVEPTKSSQFPTTPPAPDQIQATGDDNSEIPF